SRPCVSHAIIKSTAPRPAPIRESSFQGWVKQNFFSSWFNAAMTALALWALVVTLPQLVQWTIVDAVWYTPDANACKAATGACWAVIPEKYRVMLFGTFPYEEQWRGMVSVGIIL